MYRASTQSGNPPVSCEHERVVAAACADGFCIVYRRGEGGRGCLEICTGSRNTTVPDVEEVYASEGLVVLRGCNIPVSEVVAGESSAEGETRRYGQSIICYGEREDGSIIVVGIITSEEGAEYLAKLIAELTGNSKVAIIAYERDDMADARVASPAARLRVRVAFADTRLLDLFVEKLRARGKMLTLKRPVYVAYGMGNLNYKDAVTAMLFLVNDRLRVDPRFLPFIPVSFFELSPRMGEPTPAITYRARYWGGEPVEPYSIGFAVTFQCGADYTTCSRKPPKGEEARYCRTLLNMTEYNDEEERGGILELLRYVAGKEAVEELEKLKVIAEQYAPFFYKAIMPKEAAKPLDSMPSMVLHPSLEGSTLVYKLPDGSKIRLYSELKNTEIVGVSCLERDNNRNKPPLKCERKYALYISNINVNRHNKGLRVIMDYTTPLMVRRIYMEKNDIENLLSKDKNRIWAAWWPAVEVSATVSSSRWCRAYYESYEPLEHLFSAVAIIAKTLFAKLTPRVEECKVKHVKCKYVVQCENLTYELSIKKCKLYIPGIEEPCAEYKVSSEIYGRTFDIILSHTLETAPYPFSCGKPLLSVLCVTGAVLVNAATEMRLKEIVSTLLFLTLEDTKRCLSGE